MSGELAPCGTPGAYNRHRRRGEPIDEACRQARRDYDLRRYANPAIRQKVLATADAYNRALTRLRHEYPDRFQQIYAEEKATS
jgi:hypothetical protein